MILLPRPGLSYTGYLLEYDPVSKYLFLLIKLYTSQIMSLPTYLQLCRPLNIAVTLDSTVTTRYKDLLPVGQVQLVPDLLITLRELWVSILVKFREIPSLTTYKSHLKHTCSSNHILDTFACSGLLVAD